MPRYFVGVYFLVGLSTASLLKLNNLDPLSELTDASPETVAKTCFQLTLSILGPKTSPKKNLLYEKGAVEKAVLALQRLPNSPEVQSKCAWLLAFIADHQPVVAPKREISLSVARSGAVEAAIAAMRRFPEEGTVQEGCSIMFGVISDDCPENRFILAQYGAHKLSANVVRRFPKRWGIWGGLAGMSAEPSIAQYIYDQGIVDHIKHIVLSNETRYAFRVRNEAFCVLAHLAHNVPKSVNDMVNAGLLREVLLGMKDEPSEENSNNAQYLFEGVVESSAQGHDGLLCNNTSKFDELLELSSPFPMLHAKLRQLANK